MSVQNNIAPRTQMPASKPIEYEANGAKVTLTPKMVRDYLTNGDGNVSDQEVAYFINLCKYQKLNPLIKDAYLIKYGSQPAAIVTSKDAILKRAMRNPKYAGHQAGVIVLKQDGELDYRTGAFVLPNEKLIGGWARTYIEGYSVPIETAVSFDEYAGRKRDGSLNTMWKGKPGSMIRKVALVSSMREAFPEDLQGMYASEEMNAGIDDAMLGPSEIVEQPPAAPQPPQRPPQPQADELPWREPEKPQEATQTQQTIDDLDDVFR